MLTSSFLTLFFDVIISFLILVREGRPSMILFEGRGADILLGRCTTERFLMKIFLTN